MSILDIRVLGDPVLRQVTVAVTEITDELQRLIDNMFETMHHARGIGLAAPQVGRTERIAVVDLGDAPIVLINPEIVSSSGKAKGEEGCLSIPDIYADVERSSTVVMRALDRHGVEFEREGNDLLARCLQHEIDHLHGKLFLDYLSVLKRTAALAKWKLTSSDYPGYLRRVALERPEDVDEHPEAKL